MVSINVPYTPVPGQGPADIPTPYRTDRGATPTAFGAGVGEAEERMGAQFERLGDVLSTAALQRQDLLNQAAVDKADAQFMQLAGAEHEKFSQLQGADRANYFPTYQKNLTAIRDQVRQTLPSAITQRKFDTTSLSTLGRTIFNGAGAAGTAAADERIRSAGLRTEALVDHAKTLNSPSDVDAVRGQAYQSGVAAERARGTTDPTALDEAGRKAAGAVDHGYIETLSEQDPYRAQEELDKRKGNMTVQQQESAQHAVRSQRESVETTNLATSIMNANRDEQGTMKVGQRELEQQARAQAKQLHPEDPEFEIRAVAQVGTQFRKEQAENHADRVNNLNVIKGLVISGASSKQEIMATDNGAKAVRSLPPDVDVDSMISNYVKSRDRDYNKSAMVDLAWMRSHDQQNFLLLDPTDPKLQLSQENQRSIIDQQRQDAKAHPGQDPRPWAALRTLQATYGQALSDAGVNRQKDETTFNKFMANLTDSIQAWQDTHEGKVPSSKDINEVIGPELLKKVTVPGWLWGTNEVKRFQQEAEPPKDFVDNLKTAVPESTDEDVQRAWNRERLMKTFQSKASESQMGAAKGALGKALKASFQNVQP